MRIVCCLGIIASAMGTMPVFTQESAQLQFLEGHEAAARCVAYSLDGKAVVSGSADGSVRIWDWATDEIIRTAQLHAGPVLSLTVSPSGQQFATGGLDGKIQLTDLPNKNFLASLATVPNVPTEIAISKDGQLAITGDISNIVRLWNLETGAVVRDFGGSTKPITGLAILPEKKQVLASSADGFLRHWNLDNAQLQGAVFPTPLDAFAINSQGDQIAGAGQDGLLRLTAWPPVPVQSLPGFSDQVTEVALSVDEKLIAGGGQNGQVRLYSAQDGKLLQDLKGHQGPVTALALSGDASLIASGNNTGVVKVWSTTNATVQITLELQSTSINSLAFHPQLKQIVTGAADGGIQILTLEETPKDPDQKKPPAELLTLVRLKQIKAHQSAINGVSFAPDGKTILSAGADKIVRQWNAADGQELANYTGSTNALHALAVSADGKKLVAGGADAEVYLWNIPAELNAGKPAQVAPQANVAHTAAVHSVAVNEDGSIIAAGGDDRLVRIWDAESGNERERLVGHTSTVRSLALSKDGKTVISGGSDRGLRHWKASVAQIAQAHEGGIHDVRFSYDGETIYTAGADKTIRQWNAVDLKAGRVFTGSSAALKTLAVSVDGKTLAAGGDDATLRIWNTENETPTGSLKLPAAITSVMLADEGRKLIVAASENIIRNYSLDSKDGKVMFTLTNEFIGHTAPAVHLALSEDGRTLISTGPDRTVKRWFAASAEPRQTLEQGAPVYSLAFQPDSSRLASAGGNKTLKVWDLDAGKELFQCEGHSSQVYSLAFHPTEKILASGGRNDVIRLWNTATGEQISQHTAEDFGSVFSLAYANDGKWLLAAGGKNIWRGFSSEPPKEPPPAPLVGQGHNRPIQSLTYNKAGTRVATVDDSGKLIIWNPANAQALFHQQLPVVVSYSLAYAPDGTELAVATKDPRVMCVIIPPYAR